MNEFAIKSFLKFGYFIDYESDRYKIDLSNFNKHAYCNMQEKELISLGGSIFLECIGDNYESGEQHVIPLSGGLDSRALLGALLEFTEAKNIHTYTFGEHGTYDYEIGCQVARTIGTRHTAFPLNGFTYQQDELLDVARRVDCQTMLLHHPPTWTVDKLFGGATIWSGFVGDLVAGGYVRSSPVCELETAKHHYIKKCAYVRSIDLAHCSNEEFIPYIAGGELPPNILSYEEQIYFQERVAKLTAPHVLMEGYSYKTPFINNKWMDFLLSVDNKMRKDELLYVNILKTMFPKLFSIPTKTTFGLPLDATRNQILSQRIINKTKRSINRIFPTFIDPAPNYLDFNEAFRSRDDLKRIIYENIMDLHERKIVNWIDIEKIWENHQRRIKNHADALIVLASLEIHIKCKAM